MTTEGSTMLVIVLAAALVAMIVAVVKVVDRRRARESEAVLLQSQLSEAMMRDPALVHAPIAVTARVPFWSGSPAIVTVSGEVGAEPLRERALRTIEAEAARIRPDVRIEDKLKIASEFSRRAA